MGLHNILLNYAITRMSSTVIKCLGTNTTDPGQHIIQLVGVEVCRHTIFSSLAPRVQSSRGALILDRNT